MAFEGLTEKLSAAFKRLRGKGRLTEADVPERSCLSAAACSRYLRLAEALGCPPPERIEYLLMKQGGHYQSSTPFKATVCGGRPRRGTWGTSWGASENQLTLFPP